MLRTFKDSKKDEDKDKAEPKGGGRQEKKIEVIGVYSFQTWTLSTSASCSHDVIIITMINKHRIYPLHPPLKIVEHTSAG